MVQSAWYSAMDMGCYAYVRGTTVISIQIPVAAITLLHQGWVVLPLYALLLHCGEHLREKGRKKDKDRAEKKLALHRRNSVSLAASALISSIQQQLGYMCFAVKCLDDNHSYNARCFAQICPSGIEVWT